MVPHGDSDNINGDYVDDGRNSINDDGIVGGSDSSDEYDAVVEVTAVMVWWW